MEANLQPQRGRDTDLAENMRRNLSFFVRDLRAHGFVIGLAETRDALQVLSGPCAASAMRLRPALRALFCGGASDWARFDEIFDAFWLGRGVKSALRTTGAPKNAPPGLRSEPTDGEAGARRQQADHVQRGEGEDEASAGQGRREGASRVEWLTQTDFRHLTRAEDLAAAHELAARLAKSMRARLTRRMRSQRSGSRLDLRKTIHKSIAFGGTPLELARRRRRDKPLRLVVLLDASGSMSLYSSLFLRFMHGVLACFHEADAFVFHTRLIHIAPALRDPDVQRAVDRLALLGQGVGGGTRIGESLAAFNHNHARRVIHSRTCVMIVSDGYRHRPGGKTRRGNGGPAPALSPHRLAEPDDRLARLRARSRGYEGGASLCRSLRPRA